ncbi:sulfite exporter TauE/SafE family protein [Alphaproteobacteria bacterium LSUCC0684]
MFAEFLASYLSPPDFVEVPALIFWGVAIASVLLMAIAKSGFGGAVASLSAPLMLTVLPPRETLALLLPLYLLTDIWTIWIWRGYCYWRLLFWMVLFAIIGQMLGYLLISFIDDAMLKMLIGLVALITGTRYWVRWKYPLVTAHPFREKRVVRSRLVSRAGIWCSLSGFSSFISLTGGIPMQVFLLPMRLHRYLVVGTSAWYFLTINIAKLPFFFDLGLFTPATIILSTLLIPVIPVGVLLGKWLNQRINDRLFYHLAHAALFILGVRLVWSYMAAT